MLETLTIAPLERARLARSLAAIDETMLLLELRYADNARGSVLQLEHLRREICETVETAWRSDAISH